MEHTTRTLIFDDGSPTALRIPERARPVSSEIILVSVHESENHSRLEGEIASWGVRLTSHQLDRSQGIRHALEYAAEHSAMVAFVPDPGDHRGAMVRKAIQAFAKAPHFELPAVAVHVVRDVPVSDGPIVLIAQPDRDDGFANLLATAFAATVDAPMCTMTVGEELANERAVSVAPALSQEAADAIGRGAVRVLPGVHVGIDQTQAVLETLAGSRAAVVGFGGFEVKGRKWTAPDELPDSVLESELGQLVHSLVNDASSDVVIVIDGVRLRHGTAAGFAFGLVATAIVSGGVLAGGGVAGAAPPGHSQGQGYGYGRGPDNTPITQVVTSQTTTEIDAPIIVATDHSPSITVHMETAQAVPEAVPGPQGPAVAVPILEPQVPGPTTGGAGPEAVPGPQGPAVAVPILEPQVPGQTRGELGRRRSRVLKVRLSRCRSWNLKSLGRPRGELGRRRSRALKVRLSRCRSWNLKSLGRPRGELGRRRSRTPKVRLSRCRSWNLKSLGRPRGELGRRRSRTPKGRPSRCRSSNHNSLGRQPEVRARRPSRTPKVRLSRCRSWNLKSLGRPRGELGRRRSRTPKVRLSRCRSWNLKSLGRPRGELGRRPSRTPKVQPSRCRSSNHNSQGKQPEVRARRPSRTPKGQPSPHHNKANRLKRSVAR